MMLGAAANGLLVHCPSSRESLGDLRILMHTHKGILCEDEPLIGGDNPSDRRFGFHMTANRSRDEGVYSL